MSQPAAVGAARKLRELPPAQRVLARAMTEDELLKNVMALAERFRCHKYHPLPAMLKQHSPLRSDRWVTATMGDIGWLDVTILGNRGALFRELKNMANKPTPQQQKWIARWTMAGFDADWWQPVDWYSGKIEREIRAIA